MAGVRLAGCSETAQAPRWPVCAWPGARRMRRRADGRRVLGGGGRRRHERSGLLTPDPLDLRRRASLRDPPRCGDRGPPGVAASAPWGHPVLRAGCEGTCPRSPAGAVDAAPGPSRRGPNAVGGELASVLDPSRRRAPIHPAARSARPYFEHLARAPLFRSGVLHARLYDPDDLAIQPDKRARAVCGDRELLRFEDPWRLPPESCDDEGSRDRHRRREQQRGSDAHQLGEQRPPCHARSPRREGRRSRSGCPRRDRTWEAEAVRVLAPDIRPRAQAKLGRRARIAGPGQLGPRVHTPRDRHRLVVVRQRATGNRGRETIPVLTRRPWTLEQADLAKAMFLVRARAAREPCTRDRQAVAMLGFYDADNDFARDRAALVELRRIEPNGQHTAHHRHADLPACDPWGQMHGLAKDRADRRIGAGSAGRRRHLMLERLD